MQLFVPKQSDPRDSRTALTPAGAGKLKALGLDICVEAGLGDASEYYDREYEEAGAIVAPDIDSVTSRADIVFRVGKPTVKQVSQLKPAAVHISFLDPFQEEKLVAAFSEAGVSAISMEMMPRTTIAQTMDVLSSQANLAGYFAVIKAAERLNRILPMMMTPAGTISPARFFVIGVGVAGLQAIATAKRLGARVDAFDTRPVVEEQVKSLGARFVPIDLGDTGQTAQGYALALTPEQLQNQRQGMTRICVNSDVVITTAKLFGRKAPIIVTADMVARMRRGSIIVDLAAETGGNVEGTLLDEEVVCENGVTIIGYGNLATQVAYHASQVYSSNLVYFIDHFWNRESATLDLNLDDEIIKACLITHQGAIVHDSMKPH